MSEEVDELKKQIKDTQQQLVVAQAMIREVQEQLMDMSTRAANAKAQLAHTQIMLGEEKQNATMLQAGLDALKAQLAEQDKKKANGSGEPSTADTGSKTAPSEKPPATKSATADDTPKKRP